MKALATHVLQVFKEAIPEAGDRPLFNDLTREASANGLSWIEALEFVASCRRSLPSVDSFEELEAGDAATSSRRRHDQ